MHVHFKTMRIYWIANWNCNKKWYFLCSECYFYVAKIPSSRRIARHNSKTDSRPSSIDPKKRSTRHHRSCHQVESHSTSLPVSFFCAGHFLWASTVLTARGSFLEKATRSALHYRLVAAD